MENKYEIKVGEITGAHGVKGMVKVEALTDDPFGRFAVGNKVWSEKLAHELEVESCQIHKGLMLLKFKGIDDRDMAHSLLHTYLKVNKSELPKLPKGQYYHFELIGLKVYEGENYLGKVADIFTTGANDIYVIKGEEGTKDILLPALKSVVKNIDVAAGKMDVIIPAGLLD